MNIIVNTSKSVKVLKAYGKPDLRLFPGHNDVSDVKLEDYFKSAVAKGMKKECLKQINQDGLTPEEVEAAKASKKKNEKLNKSRKTIIKPKK